MYFGHLLADVYFLLSAFRCCSVVLSCLCTFICAGLSGSMTVIYAAKQILHGIQEDDIILIHVRCRYLHKSVDKETHEYLCHRLYTLPEEDLERYLSQLCQLCISSSDESLQRVLLGLCGRSLRIAVKTYWLILAISQDNSKDASIASFRDSCELAGLSGHWELPFGEGLVSPCKSSSVQSSSKFVNRFTHRLDQQQSSQTAEFSQSPFRIASPSGLDITDLDAPNSPSRIVSPQASMTISSEMDRPDSPVGLGNGIYSSVFVDAGVEGLIYQSGVQGPSRETSAGKESSSTPLKDIPILQTPLRSLRKGNDGSLGVYPSSPVPMSKRRETTFGATLDFVEALCMASNNLTAFAPEEREWALHKALKKINNEMDRAAAAGVAVWWPLGSNLHQRVLRLAYKESRLLNSREKAPFTLFVEVLDESAAKASRQQSTKVPNNVAEFAHLSPSALSPPSKDVELDPAATSAAAEALAEGIPWVAHHHRASSQDAVTFKSATCKNQESFAGASKLSSNGKTCAQAPSGGGHSMLDHSSVPSLFSAFPVTTLKAEISVQDIESQESRCPTKKLSHSNRDNGSTSHSNGHVLMNGPTRTGSQIQGGGTWIGASGIKGLGGWSPVIHSNLINNYSLSEIHGNSPRILVEFSVNNGNDLAKDNGGSQEGKESDHSSFGSSCDDSVDLEDFPLAGKLGTKLRRSNTVPFASRPVVHPQPNKMPLQTENIRRACSRNGWLCKLGLCRSCSSATRKGEQDPMKREQNPSKTIIENDSAEPFVKVSLIVKPNLDLSLKRNRVHQRMPSHEALLQVAKQHKLPPPPPSHILDSPGSNRQVNEMHGSSNYPQSRSEACMMYGESWTERKARIKRASFCGDRPGWDLRCVIVKSGDDCRQELLAMQLITAFYEIFQEARLPLYLRPYEVLVTSNKTALIEMVPNAPSIHAIKSNYAPGMSLREHFIQKNGPSGSSTFVKAQRNFVESLAAYSLVCYFLQIRDRHNGNILLDDAGHLIHIDFGFMLSNSPGGVNFESAPFKLTKELLEVMDSDAEGSPSEAFDYFKILIIQGFLAVRKHSERIVLLVEMMADSGCPCFKNRISAVQGVKRRLALGLAEPALIDMVLGLISDSLDAWSTRQYDMYQRVLNGIL